VSLHPQFAKLIIMAQYSVTSVPFFLAPPYTFLAPLDYPLWHGLPGSTDTLNRFTWAFQASHYST